MKRVAVRALETGRRGLIFGDRLAGSGLHTTVGGQNGSHHRSLVLGHRGGVHDHRAQAFLVLDHHILVRHDRILFVIARIETLVHALEALENVGDK